MIEIYAKKYTLKLFQYIKTYKGITKYLLTGFLGKMYFANPSKLTIMPSA